MKIATASKTWENKSAYQMAKLMTDDKETDAKTVKQEEHAGETSGNETNAATKIKDTESADTDVFLSSINQKENTFTGLLGLSSSQEPKSSGGFDMKSSAPDDSVGQLAAMLARAETKLDVQQVSGKAMRALVNLKSAAATAKGDDAKKLAAQIRRMEKLIKRIEKKLKHLGKEEQLELEQKRALEKEEKQKAELIEDELKTRRKKRRRDEKNYAAKELAEDQKESSNEMLSAIAGGGIAPPSADSFMDVGTEMVVPDVVSLDVTV